MAYSTQRVVSDGSLVLLSVSIGYLERSHIHVFFNNVENALPWAWVGSTSNQISFTPAVPNGTEVLVARKTDISEPYNIFTQGAQFTAESLDEDMYQVLYIAQEATEQAVTGDYYSDINMHGYKITNVADAVASQDVMTLGQAVDIVQPYADAAALSAISADSFADAAAASAAAAAASAGSIAIGVPGGVATLNGSSKVVQKALDADHADTATTATTAASAGTAATATTAANLLGRAQLGNSGTATHNFTITAEAADGTMKLARGNAGATTQDIMVVNESGVVKMPGNVVAFSAYANVGQSIPNITATKLLFQVEEFDTHNFFAAGANSRFQPTVAGYYFISMSAMASGSIYPRILLYKNGVQYKGSGAVGASLNNPYGASLTCLVYLNGSTDYAEAYFEQASGSTLTANGTQDTTYFQGHLLGAV